MYRPWNGQRRVRSNQEGQSPCVYTPQTTKWFGKEGRNQGPGSFIDVHETQYLTTEMFGVGRWDVGSRSSGKWRLTPQDPIRVEVLYHRSRDQRRRQAISSHRSRII
jgi:hypothetical protein